MWQGVKLAGVWDSGCSHESSLLCLELFSFSIMFVYVCICTLVDRGQRITITNPVSPSIM